MANHLYCRSNRLWRFPRRQFVIKLQQFIIQFYQLLELQQFIKFVIQFFIKQLVVRCQRWR